MTQIEIQPVPLGAKFHDYYYAVQGYSPQRRHFITLFAPYNCESDACRKAIALRNDNPQILYRVIARRHAEQH